MSNLPHQGQASTSIIGENATSPSQRPSAANKDPRVGPTGPQLGQFYAAVVIDTHHPDLPGRVCVSWVDSESKTHNAWLATNASFPFEVGMQVMLLRPDNWQEWVVAFPLGVQGASATRAATSRTEKQVQLQQAETLAILGQQGQTLLRILQDPQGRAVMELPDDLSMETKGVLRLRAQRLELRSGEGGTDLRSEGETVVRSTKIHLN